MAVLVQGLEGHGRQGPPVQRCGARGHALGPAEAVGNGGAHIGRAQLRHHRAVAVLHHRVDDALRMDHHLDLRRRHAKQVARLDHLQRLVHHGGRIDRDLASHDPVRVRAGLLGRDRVQGGGVAGAKRPARRGQDEAVNALGPGGRVVRQGLEDGRMLGVDRQQGGAALAHGLQKHLGAHHQGFFVGQQQALARAGGGQAGREARRADDGRHDGVHLIAGRNLVDRRSAPAHLHRQALGAHALGQHTTCGLVGHHRHLRSVLGTQGQHGLGAGGGHQGIKRKTPGVARQHIQRVLTDRAGGAQHRDPLH